MIIGFIKRWFNIYFPLFNKNTPIRSYYDNGQIELEWPRLNGKWHGIQNRWHENGIMSSCHLEINGMNEGIHECWKTKQERLCVSTYKNNNDHGPNIKLKYFPKTQIPPWER